MRAALFGIILYMEDWTSCLDGFGSGLPLLIAPLL